MVWHVVVLLAFLAIVVGVVVTLVVVASARSGARGGASYAGPVPPAPPVPPVAGQPAGAAERLAQLDDLRRRGLVDEVEYQRQRQRIIGEI